MNELCSPYLAHHGIKGRRWGARRYQNADGSCNAAGKARYGIKDERSNSKSKSSSEKSFFKKVGVTLYHF